MNRRHKRQHEKLAKVQRESDAAIARWDARPPDPVGSISLPTELMSVAMKTGKVMTKHLRSHPESKELTKDDNSWNWHLSHHPASEWCGIHMDKGKTDAG